MMEFEDEHEEEEEEEEEEDDEMVVTPTFKPPQLNNNNSNNNIVINSPSNNIIMAHHHESKPKPGPIAACRYRECLKNHAVGLGGHAVDGCGEFMPAGVDGSLDALKCAACNCHRNFHRKELLLESSSAGGGPHNQLALFNPRPHHPPPPQPPQQVFQFYPYNRTSASNPTPSPPPWAPQVRPLALPSPAGERMESVEREEKEQQQVNLMGGGSGCSSSGKKRHRTKFSQEQKDKMFELAERLGWRIQKQDEEIVQHFCNETGVKRHVLKVWMHNNKHTLGKKP